MKPTTLTHERPKPKNLSAAELCEVAFTLGAARLPLEPRFVCRIVKDNPTETARDVKRSWSKHITCAKTRLSVQRAYDAGILFQDMCLPDGTKTEVQWTGRTRQSHARVGAYDITSVCRHLFSGHTLCRHNISIKKNSQIMWNASPQRILLDIWFGNHTSPTPRNEPGWFDKVAPKEMESHRAQPTEKSKQKLFEEVSRQTARMINEHIDVTKDHSALMPHNKHKDALLVLMRINEGNTVTVHVPAASNPKVKATLFVSQARDDILEHFDILDVKAFTGSSRQAHACLTFTMLEKSTGKTFPIEFFIETRWAHRAHCHRKPEAKIKLKTPMKRIPFLCEIAKMETEVEEHCDV